MKTDSANFYGYNRNLKNKANRLRKEMTKAEACLWKYSLKARQMNANQFRRQCPVLNYIADFMCKELYLIIEVDGITHSFDKVAEKDVIRQEKLEKAGFTVLRFTDDEVLTAIDRVHAQIAYWIEENAKVPPLSPVRQLTEGDVLNRPLLVYGKGSDFNEPIKDRKSKSTTKA